MNKLVIVLWLATGISINVLAQNNNLSSKIDQKDFDPATLLWYDAPAAAWEEALPVGNGRLGAMIFGKYEEERIQINEETYWSGGPYSTVVKGGAEALPQIQKYIFEGQPIEAHKLFGRKLMGYPVEQQKYQSLANLHLFFANQKEVTRYKRWLDLNTGITSVEYTTGDITYHREILTSTPDQVILVRLTASKPGSLSFKVQLRGVRNSAHSNYATDYFRMDATGSDGLMLNGKSADYMGIEGKLRYRAQLKAVPEGGTMTVTGDMLNIEKADAVTLIIAAATNFVNYKDVSANEVSRVQNYLEKVKGKSYEEMVSSSVEEYQKFFKRVSLELPKTEQSYLPTNKRMAGLNENADPS
ncbi:MAG: glycoside hydrolase family 95 protein, partial [Bacteroidota bacterium]|nr:glycoside hydrolase family 95 protein [Bacteroidota bacterium]